MVFFLPLIARHEIFMAHIKLSVVCGATVYMETSRTPPRSRQKALFTATIVSPEGFGRSIPAVYAVGKCLETMMV